MAAEREGHGWSEESYTRSRIREVDCAIGRFILKLPLEEEIFFFFWFF